MELKNILPSYSLYISEVSKKLTGSTKNDLYMLQIGYDKLTSIYYWSWGVSKY